MKLKNYARCDRCKKTFDKSPFACMCGDGERSDAEVEVYGAKYDLCPSCTWKLSQFLGGKELNESD